MRQEKKYNYIYKTTCKITKRYYIGMHSTDDLDDGYLGSGKRLWFSMNYHGKENHTKEILEYCDSREELKKREAEIVDEQLLTEDLCMNLMEGGTGGFSCEEHRKKFLEKAVTMFSVNKEKINNRKNWLWSNDEEWSKNYSEKMSNNANGNKSWTNKTHSEETKQKMSESSKGMGRGSNNSQYGTMWIHCKATGEVKKIKKEDWITYKLKSDYVWEKGRK